MKKEVFLKSIEAIEKYCNFRDKLYKIGIDTFENDALDGIEHWLVVNLANQCKLNYNDIYGSDLDYFLYEIDFGRNYKPGDVTEEDGTEIDFSSAEKIWEYFVKKHPEIEDKE